MKTYIFTQILEAVETATEIPRERILSREKQPEVVEARSLLFHFLLKKGFRQAEIARLTHLSRQCVSGASEYSKGPHWSMDVLKSFLTSRNLPVEEKPYYNWPALWVTVNMIYSDYADTIADLLGSKENERLATASYKMALRKLKDPDRPQFIRDYFDLD